MRRAIVDRRSIRPERSLFTLEQPANRGLPKSALEVLSLVWKWRAGMDIEENWSVALRRQKS